MVSMDILGRLTQYLETGRCDKFIELLNQNPGIDLNVICSVNGTLLHKAARYKMFECVQELIARGVDINFQAKNYPPVLLATSNNYLSRSLVDEACYHMIKLLIESGADCNCYFDDGEDLLHFFCWFVLYVCRYGYIKEILGVLLDHGANREYVYKGHTVESLLRAYKKDDLADFVRDYEVVPGTKGVYDG
jgi:hypothetical protein